MIYASVKTIWEGEKVKKHLADTTFKSINHAAATLRLIVRRSILRRKGASRAGTPPNTRGRLRESIMYYATRSPNIYAIIGPSFNFVGISAVPHEFSGMYKGERFPKRAFMWPGAEKIIPRLPAEWQF